MEGAKKKKVLDILLGGASIFLIMIVFFSVLIDGTFGWKDLDQHTSMTLTSANQGFSVLLQKYEGTDQPMKVGSVLYLYRVEEDDRMVQIGERLVTDAAGQIFLTDLDVGKYCLVDADPQYGYTWDTDEDGEARKLYPFTLDLSTAEDHLLPISIRNKRLTADLTIINSAESMEYAVQLSAAGSYRYSLGAGGTDADGGELRSGGSLTLGAGQTAVIKGLPVGTTYKISGKGEIGAVVNKTNFDDIIPPEGITAKFETVKDAAAPELLRITKAVKGHETDKVFTLMTVIGETETAVELKNGQQKELPIPASAGWSVIEAGYWDEFYNTESELKHIKEEGGTYAAVFTKTSKYYGGGERTVAGEVTWNLSQYPDAVLPESIEVLLLDGENIAKRLTVTPNSEGKWLYSFTAPEFRPDGKTAIDYMVGQAPAEGFGITVTGMDITNTPVSPVVQDIFFVRQTITVVGQPPAEFPEFKYILEAEDENSPLPEKTELAIAGEGQSEFGEVKFEKAGVYKYTITHVKGSAPGFVYDNAVFHVTVRVEASGTELAASTVYRRNDEPDAYDCALFKNEFVYKSADTTIAKATVKWENDDKNLRPKSIGVQLYRDGLPFGEPVPMTAENDWSHVWIQLDKSADWTVSVPMLPDGYDKEVSDDGENNFVITCFIAEDLELFAEDAQTIGGKVTWNHGNNPLMPEGVTIRIMNKGVIVLERLVSQSMDWEWSETLPKYGADGIEIEYTLDMAGVYGYNAVIEGYDITVFYAGESSGAEGGTAAVQGKPHDAPETGDTTTAVFLWALTIAVCSIFVKIMLFGKRRFMVNR